MRPPVPVPKELNDLAADLRARLEEANEVLQGIKMGNVDAVVVQGNRLFTLNGADEPYRVLIEEINQGAVTLSANGFILYCNRRFANLLKVPVDQIFGFAFETFVESSEQASFAGLLKAGRSGASSAEITLSAGDMTRFRCN